MRIATGLMNGHADGGSVHLRECKGYKSKVRLIWTSERWQRVGRIERMGPGIQHSFSAWEKLATDLFSIGSGYFGMTPCSPQLLHY